MEETYAIIDLSPEPPAVKKAAEALELALRIPYDDAAGAANRGGGFYARNLERQAAETACALLRNEGLQTAAIPSAAIRKPAPPLHFTKATLGGDTFSAPLDNGTLFTAKWSDAIYLIAAPVKNRTIVTEAAPKSDLAARAATMAISVATMLPIGMLKGKGSDAPMRREMLETEFFMELAFGLSGERCRMSAGSFDYSCLGTKRQYSSQLNFRVLVQETAAHLSPETRRNRAACAIMAGGNLAGLGYNSSEDMEAEASRLLTAAVFSAQI